MKLISRSMLSVEIDEAQNIMDEFLRIETKIKRGMKMTEKKNITPLQKDWWKNLDVDQRNFMKTITPEVLLLLEKGDRIDDLKIEIENLTAKLTEKEKSFIVDMIFSQDEDSKRKYRACEFSIDVFFKKLLLK